MNFQTNSDGCIEIAAAMFAVSTISVIIRTKVSLHRRYASTLTRFVMIVGGSARSVA